jgi:hypothetical protein
VPTKTIIVARGAALGAQKPRSTTPSGIENSTFVAPVTAGGGGVSAESGLKKVFSLIVTVRQPSVLKNRERKTK